MQRVHEFCPLLFAFSYSWTSHAWAICLNGCYQISSSRWNFVTLTNVTKDVSLEDRAVLLAICLILGLICVWLFLHKHRRNSWSQGFAKWVSLSRLKQKLISESEGVCRCHCCSATISFAVRTTGRKEFMIRNRSFQVCGSLHNCRFTQCQAHTLNLVI